jgi:hypothetical protein
VISVKRVEGVPLWQRLSSRVVRGSTVVGGLDVFNEEGGIDDGNGGID